ncbi:hypothetical protein JOE32_002539 [Pseudomonas sp. PvP025]|nr:hypothetical protein [Pseudomonas sp. PvP025]MDQ0399931.1 hypothetical protein [Pseudomonas sp. PvP006]
MAVGQSARLWLMYRYREQAPSYSDCISPHLQRTPSERNAAGV